MSRVVSVNQYIEEHPKWRKELKNLRELFLSYKLEESIKWGAPVYMLNSKNLFSLAAFKNHYAIWLFYGSLLDKNTDLLENAQEGKTNAMRQIKFNETSVINFKELSKYIEETITLFKQGKKIVLPQKKTVMLAEELKTKLKEDQDFEKAFQNLTPGKQREYSEYIDQAKKEETRSNRLDKIIPMVLVGKGLNDKYRNC